MSNFIYSASSGVNDAFFGKFPNHIKMLIENESNQCEKNKTILDKLFNVEKSNKFAETVMGESDFDVFKPQKEGQRAENDNVGKTYHKTIEHIEFSKRFTITRKMADDAKFGIGADVKLRPRRFTRSYYKTRVKLAAQALINGTKSTMDFYGEPVDLTTSDGLSLFNKAHTYSTDKMKGKTQSNYYWGDISSSAAKLEEALGVAANNLRNFKDENGENMGYTADIMIIPCNRPKLEMMAKKVIGTERTTGADYNDINTQYGGWTLVVLDGWETEDDRFMVMSSEANENLGANMFYNRVKLEIHSWVDDETGNLCYRGYCRFGVGFTTWKHMALCVNSSTAVSAATALFPAA